MLCALAREALADAMVHGTARLSFHGYRVDARRLCVAGADGAIVDLTLAGGCGAEVLDRVRIAVAFLSDSGSACRIDPLRATAMSARKNDLLAGCVSPVDARYASPEAGHIS